ncbi:hypothetical protein CONPUDRAFT_163064 [Coniophora puteana RWD-64-598 SS2]|uniref:F-box domain-containing protein n=1 Tax=Coniophora puteana (strain RWD-64-598) TaxID=741705 RepID=A0A5M3MXE4_CONPW|nr:uncharacterized protein CONPUDRAFT_163064 [Coniophora puteana RWD-64-598 SS2]EIW83760.1 hypothetical protein CONPUDRAFT_163064 [Coniophora puteana RWD-64-598 SS2]
MAEPSDLSEEVHLADVAAAIQPWQTPSIVSLPTETLLEIFKLVSLDPRYDINGRIGTVCEVMQDFASVCPKFFDVLTLVPEYWTFIGLRPLRSSRCRSFFAEYPSLLERIFEASRDLQFEIAVYNPREVALDRLKKETERLQVTRIVKALSLHLSRCTCLHVETRYRSSILNSIPHLSGLAAPNLRRFQLISGEADSTDGLRLDSLNLPRLRYLTIDTCSFINLSSATMSASHEGEETSLYVHLMPFSSSLSADAVLHALTALDKRYTIVDLFMEHHLFDGPPQNLPVPIRHFSSIAFADIRDNMGFFPALLSNFRSTDTVTFHTCHLFCPMTIDADRLLLNQISKDSDLRHALSSWTGTQLHVTCCKSFNDDLLDAMAILGTTAEKRSVLCPRLETLIIEDCECFSYDSLLRMVEAREPPLLTLDIRGNTCKMDYSAARTLGHSVDEIHFETANVIMDDY